VNVHVATVTRCDNGFAEIISHLRVFATTFVFLFYVFLGCGSKPAIYVLLSVPRNEMR